MLCDLFLAGDNGGRIIVGHAIICYSKFFQMQTIMFGGNDIQREDPGKIDLVAPERLKGVGSKCHRFKLSLASIMLDDLLHNGYFIGSTISSIDFAIQITRALNIRIGSCDQVRGVVSSDGRNRENLLM